MTSRADFPIAELWTRIHRIQDMTEQTCDLVKDLLVLTVIWQALLVIIALTYVIAAAVTHRSNKRHEQMVKNVDVEK
ncbi:hypothetical protein C8034_v011230 [Colletotrichum sidae]|uniref:Uncharacterized protein n=3 Tax=Colletotrichum orbiculare species complex TaxID=2707354 RepID=A0A4R8RU07_COLTR|nr:hypothetical protein C8035_v008182 [Colletotrichum spinosum]TDZ61617.1 hypothetical protein CTRI78_v004268 [Colletotrichum trifolii]TEA18053.1 hypothetical protein C8034_v011230 [Colletotrichum sidae]